MKMPRGHLRAHNSQKGEALKEIHEHNAIEIHQDSNQEIVQDLKSDDTPQSHIKSPLPKEKVDQLMNPYLIFHSPLQSDVSPFKKQRPTGIKQSESGLKRKDIKKVKHIPKLTFTNLQRSQNCKIGSIILSKYQLPSKLTLTYSSKQRTFINIAKCGKCFKVFDGHEALGGHKRACKKGQ